MTIASSLKLSDLDRENLHILFCKSCQNKGNKNFKEQAILFTSADKDKKQKIIMLAALYSILSLENSTEFINLHNEDRLEINNATKDKVNIVIKGDNSYVYNLSFKLLNRSSEQEEENR